MVIKKGTPLAFTPERRQFGRIHIAEPRICHACLTQSQELWIGQGLLVNISLGGIYFVWDKPRILYQYYDLNKKAYEIITNTPDVRTEKIKKIKKFIETGSYEVKSETIAQSVINDIFMEEILLE